MNQEEHNKIVAQTVARCWADEGFKRALLADPTGTLKAQGFTVPAGVTVKAVENSDTIFHVVIPAKPADLTDDDLDKVAGGWVLGICSASGPGFTAGL